MPANIPHTSKKRVVIVGGGFAGLTLSKKLSASHFQIVLLDAFNYHQFQPLLYQVATSGLEPSTISFPFRKIFQKKKDCHFRLCKASGVDRDHNRVITDIGNIDYDYLVIACGSATNYFGMKDIRETAMPMKSVSEALGLRNTLLGLFEKALCSDNPAERQALLNIVVVGGGPTGVEIAGALAEMKKYILPKDYQGTDFSEMQVYLVEAASKLLSAMSEQASAKSLSFLQKMGVSVKLNGKVTGYKNGRIEFADETKIATRTVIWTGGVTCNHLSGMDSAEMSGKANRLKVDAHHKVTGCGNIFAIGDICLQTEEKYPDGHPQLAQVAIQQAKNLAKNLKNMQTGDAINAFRYFDKGSMATIGRNKAVADLPFLRIQGFFAWMIWMLVHLMSILGTKNKFLTLINWIWSYLNYNPSLRLIIRPKEKQPKIEDL